MENIADIKKRVIQYCIENRNTVIGFDSMSDEDREHVYELGASIVYTKFNIMQGGSFIQAVVDNNLERAISTADRVAIRCIKLLVLIKFNFTL